MNNSYKFTVPGTNQSITIPIEMQWDFLGRDDSIDEYQTDVLKIIAGLPEDFEVIRFDHNSYGSDNKTLLNYQFYFYSGLPANVTASTITDWVTDFNAEGFTNDEIYYKTKPFTKSFFKLDFYDSKDSAKQQNSFTIIIPVYKSNTKVVNLNTYIPNVKINIPTYDFDYIPSFNNTAINEGFFYYWLKSRTFIDLNKFYMTIKFFDAKQGVYVRMMTVPQSSLPNKFVFNNDNFFYNTVLLNYNTKTYEIYDYTNNRIGVSGPIKWYEYVNP